MVKVRAAVEGDSHALWEWRNDPRTRANSLASTEVALEDHSAWFARSLMSSTRRIFIGVDPDLGRIGMVRFDRDGARSTVSINLAPHARGRGLSAPLLDLAIGAYVAQDPEVSTLVAEVKDGNVASLRLFASAGFTPRAVDDGIWTYLREV